MANLVREIKSIIFGCSVAPTTGTRSYPCTRRLYDVLYYLHVFSCNALCAKLRAYESIVDQGLILNWQQVYRHESSTAVNPPMLGHMVLYFHTFLSQAHLISTLSAWALKRSEQVFFIALRCKLQGLEDAESFLDDSASRAHICRSRWQSESDQRLEVQIAL